MKNFLLLTASIFLIMILFEVYLRIFSPQIFDVHPEGMYSADKDAGYILTPGYSGVVERDEFESPIRINSFGLRDRELSPAADETRILCLGDSFTFGFGVDADSSYPKLLETLLKGRYNKKIRVINAGVPGYGTADQLNFLRSRADIFMPDIVVVQFLSINDFEENDYPAADRVEISEGMLKTRSGKGDPYDNLSFFQKILLWSKTNLHSAKFLSERIGYLAMTHGLLSLDDFWGENIDSASIKNTHYYIKELKSECGSLNADLIMLYTAGQGHVLADSVAPLNSEIIVTNICSDLEIPMINSLREMRKESDKNEFYFPLDGHWRVAGHKAVAGLLKNHIEKNGYIML